MTCSYILLSVCNVCEDSRLFETELSELQLSLFTFMFIYRYLYIQHIGTPYFFLSCILLL